MQFSDKSKNILFVFTMTFLNLLPSDLKIGSCDLSDFFLAPSQYALASDVLPSHHIPLDDEETEPAPIHEITDVDVEEKPWRRKRNKQT